MIHYKELSLGDVQDDFLSSFNRYQEAHQVLVNTQDQLIMKLDSTGITKRNCQLCMLCVPVCKLEARYRRLSTEGAYSFRKRGKQQIWHA